MSEFAREGVWHTRPLRMLRILLPRRGKTEGRVPRLTQALVALLAVETALFALGAVFPPDMTRARHSSPVTLDRRGAWLRALPVEDGPGGEPEVLLVRQYRYPAGGWLLEVPGGKLDGAEDPEVCARRELAEEIGVRPAELIPLGWIWTTPGFTDEKIWLFLARDLAPSAAAPEDHEVLALERLPLAEAVARAARGEIQDAKTVCTLLRAAAWLGLPLS